MAISARRAGRAGARSPSGMPGTSPPVSNASKRPSRARSRRARSRAGAAARESRPGRCAACRRPRCRTVRLFRPRCRAGAGGNNSPARRENLLDVFASGPPRHIATRAASQLRALRLTADAGHAEDPSPVRRSSPSLRRSPCFASSARQRPEVAPRHHGPGGLAVALLSRFPRGEPSRESGRPCRGAPAFPP
jgi:hypothetical protein